MYCINKVRKKKKITAKYMYLNCFSRFSIQSIQTTSTSRNVRISLIEVWYSVVNTFKVAQFSKSSCALRKYYDSHCRTKFNYLVITAFFNSWWNNTSSVVIISLTVYSDLGPIKCRVFYEFQFGEICRSHHGHAAFPSFCVTKAVQQKGVYYIL